MKPSGRQVKKDKYMAPQKNEIVVYQPNETIRLGARLENETVWLTQTQLGGLFKRDVSVISRHIKNIFAFTKLGSGETAGLKARA